MIANLFIIASLVMGFGNSDIGTSAFPILREAFGPRAAALGETFVALSDDATASWWNPAGLGEIESNYIFFSHHKWFLDTRDEYLTGIIQTPYGRFSPSIIYSGINGVESWSESEQQLTSFSTSTTILQLAYGTNISPKFSIGFGAKGIYDNLKTVKATGMCLDLGIIYHPKKWLGLGASLQNLGPPVNYLTDKVSLPLGARTGISLKYFSNLICLLDLNIPDKGSIEVHSGFEYCILNMLFLRGGFRTGPQNSELGYVTYGTGINWHNLGIDYAFVPYSVLGSTHRFALSYNFTSTLAKKHKKGLKITVLDAYTNSPLAAEITFAGAYEGKETTAVGNGQFHREFFPEGAIAMEVKKNGYAAVKDSFFHKKDDFTIIKVLMRKPMPSAIIGMIYDAETRLPISGNLDFSGHTSGNAVTKQNGSYEIGNLKQGSYKFTAISQNYISQSKSVYLGSGELKEVSFYLIKKQGKILLTDIHFDTGKADLRDEAQEILNSIGLALQEHPSYKLKIEGHTDIREIHTTDFPSNWELSRARANAAKEYIVKRYKISELRFYTQGFADTKPVAPNDTEENLQKNRRVEFTILK